MKKRVAQVFLLSTQVILIVSLICFIASVVGTHWCDGILTTLLSRQVSFGLTQDCREDSIGCKGRLGILQFRDETWPVAPFLSLDFDVILITFIVAMIFTILALILSMTLYCTKRGHGRWRCISTFVAVMVTIGVLASLVGIAYFEKKLTEKQLNFAYKHGWSSVVAWLGFGCLIVDMVLIIVVSRVKPDDHSSKPHSVRTAASYQSSETEETWASSHNNKAFEFTEVKSDAFYVGRKKNERDERSDPPQRREGFNRSSILKNDYRKNETDNKYGSPRGSNNFVYQPEIPENLVYDPRRRSTKSSSQGRRKRSIELAYESSRQSDDSSYDAGRASKRPPQNIPREVSGRSPYDPSASRQPVNSKYDPHARPSARHSNRYPGMYNEGYEVR